MAEKSTPFKDFFSSGFEKPTFGSSLQAAGSLYSGISSYQVMKSQAAQTEAQGAVQFAESMRTANIIREEGQKFAAKQSLQYIGSGVHLTGSALITLTQTKKYASTEARAEERKGRNLRSLANAQAANQRAEGRAALVSGIVGTAGAFMGGGG